MTFFKYQVNLYDSEAITYFNAVSPTRGLFGLPRSSLLCKKISECIPAYLHGHTHMLNQRWTKGVDLWLYLKNIFNKKLLGVWEQDNLIHPWSIFGPDIPASPPPLSGWEHAGWPVIPTTQAGFWLFRAPYINLPGLQIQQSATACG
jgi:hypothetical protein